MLDNSGDTATDASFEVRLAAIERRWKSAARRRRIALAAVLAVVLCAGMPLAVHEYRYRFASASVDVVGSWLLNGVQHNGQPTVGPGDLVDGGPDVPLQFSAGGKFAMADVCVTTTGDYRVTTEHLSFSNTGAPAVACGYATAESERVGTAIAEATNAVLEHGGVVSTPSVGDLDVATRDGGYVLHYVRSPAPQPRQLRPS